MTRAKPITGQYRINLSEFIWRYANTGYDDPTIATQLEITAAQVRAIRKEYKIPAGKPRRPGGAR